MDSLVIFVLLFVAALFFLKFLARSRTRTAPAEQLQYRRRPALFSAAERSFAGVQVQLPLIRVPAQKAYKLADVEAFLKPLRDLAAQDGSALDGVTTPLRAKRDDSGWAAGV